MKAFGWGVETKMCECSETCVLLQSFLVICCDLCTPADMFFLSDRLMDLSWKVDMTSAWSIC